MANRLRVLALLTLVSSLCLTGVAPASFPGKNGRIVFESGGGGGGGDDSPSPSPSSSSEAIEDIKPSGKGSRTLLSCTKTEGQPDTGDCSLGDFSQPSYSPDGSQILFVAGAQIGVMDKGGVNQRLFPVSTPNVADPAFSPDGKQVVFTGYTVGKEDHGLYVLDLGTKVARQLAPRGRQPSWSSRNRIAFVRSGSIYSIRPNGTGLKLVIRNGTEPDWSPHGSKIAFTREQIRRESGRSSTIRITRVGTGRSRVLRSASHDAYSPAWSPDGKLITYSADIQGSVSVIGSDGRRNRLLLGGMTGDSGSTGYASPSWQPVR